MTERYDSAAAEHYAAFRPPLHPLILGRLLSRAESFRTGLDIGCGTGYSAVALSAYADRVFALDSSRAMLDRAQTHSSVTYLEGSAEDLGRFPEAVFDVVSFAGSLSYTKSNRLRAELLRVCRPGCTILVYDFQVCMENVLTGLGVNNAAAGSDYNYVVRLSDWAGFQTRMQGTDRIQLKVTPEELAHVLLADSNRYDLLAGHFPGRDVFAFLAGFFHQGNPQLEADIYFARHEVAAAQAEALRRTGVSPQQVTRPR